MGLLARLLAPRPRFEPTPAPELRRSSRDGDGWGAAMALGSARAPMAPHLAETLGAALACIQLISGAVASLPASLTADAADGQVPAPLTATGWGLLRRPNPRQSWPAFMSSMTAGVLRDGNAVAALRRDGRGAVVELVPVPWNWLALRVIRGLDGPRLVYDLAGTGPELDLLGLPRRLLDSDVLHLRARSDEGIIGRSVLARAAGVVREGMELNAAAEASWRNGMRPSGIVQFPQGSKLSDAAFERLKADLRNQYAGAGHVGTTPILENGATFVQTSMNSADAEFLASRQFSVAEVARLFSVPLGLLQPGTGVQPYEAMVAAFAQLALAPLIASIETEFDHAVLPPGLHLQIDLAGLLRGSFGGQVAALAVATQSGIMTPNDSRRALGLPAHPGGDELRPNGAAPSWPADASGVPSLGPKPGHTGAAGLPNVGTNENEGQGTGP